ncbi:MAG: divalent-cation tolerance protein CutA [candidate division WOR-3 bacterium]
MKFVFVYTTLPNKLIAKKIGRILVEEKLVACVNFFPIESIYRWKEKLVEEKEFILIMKTRKSLYKKLEKRLKEIHPYEIPAIVSYEIKNGFIPYLSWIEKETIRDK